MIGILSILLGLLTASASSQGLVNTCGSNVPCTSGTCCPVGASCIIVSEPRVGGRSIEGCCPADFLCATVLTGSFPDYPSGAPDGECRDGLTFCKLNGACCKAGETCGSEGCVFGGTSSGEITLSRRSLSPESFAASDSVKSSPNYPPTTASFVYYFDSVNWGSDPAPPAASSGGGLIPLAASLPPAATAKDRYFGGGYVSGKPVSFRNDVWETMTEGFKFSWSPSAGSETASSASATGSGSSEPTTTITDTKTLPIEITTNSSQKPTSSGEGTSSTTTTKAGTTTTKASNTVSVSPTASVTDGVGSGAGRVYDREGIVGPGTWMGILVTVAVMVYHR